jgi:hypothetical protein
MELQGLLALDMVDLVSKVEFLKAASMEGSQEQLVPKGLQYMDQAPASAPIGELGQELVVP